jgi:hypothetical protein
MDEIARLSANILHKYISNLEIVKTGLKKA